MIRLTQFGLLTLPPNMPRNRNELRFTSRALKTAGGAYDAWRSDSAEREYPWTFPYSCIVVGANRAALQTTVEALEGLGGDLLRLWGTAEDGTLRWAWARLMSVSYDYNPKNVRHLSLDMSFEMWTRGGWHGAGHGGAWNLDAGYMLDSGLYLDQSAAVALADGVNTITLLNAGNRDVVDVDLTITAGDTTAFSTVTVATALSEFTWSGTMDTLKSLVLHCQSRSVYNDGAEAYSGFQIGANHYSNYWLPLPKGVSTPVTVTIDDAGGDLAVPATFLATYSDGWR